MAIPFGFTHGIVIIVFLVIVSVAIRSLRKDQVCLISILHWSILLSGVILPFLLMAHLEFFGLLYKERYAKGAGYGDLPFHMGLISSFAFGCNSKRTSLFGIVSPFYANERLAYPFIPNFYSAVLIGCFGSSFHNAIVVPSLFFTFALFTIITSLSHSFSASSSIASMLSSWLYLFSGGLGFTRFPKYRKSFYIDFVHNWGDNRHEYWFNEILHVLLPQRASLFSLPVAWSVIYLLSSIEAHSVKLFALVGILVGILPQVQAHSVIALAQWGVVFAILTTRKFSVFVHHYGTLGAIALAIGLPQTVPYMGRMHSGFMKLSPLSNGHPGRNIVTLWLYGLGLFGVLALLVGPFLLTLRQRVIYIPSLVVWLAANFVWYQPWYMDNTKVFNAAWVPLAACVVALVVQKASKHSVALAVLLFVVSTLSGVCSLKPALTESYPIWPNSLTPFKFADFVKANTEPTAVWIAPESHSSPIAALAGRQSLLGYAGWVTSHGLSLTERRQATKATCHNPDNLAFIVPHNVRYVYCDEQKIKCGPFNASKKWELIYSNDKFNAFRVNQTEFDLQKVSL